MQLLKTVALAAMAVSVLAAPLTPAPAQALQGLAVRSPVLDQRTANAANTYLEEKRNDDEKYVYIKDKRDGDDIKYEYIKEKRDGDDIKYEYIKEKRNEDEKYTYIKP